jgi:hypothetical protein
MVFVVPIGRMVVSYESEGMWKEMMICFMVVTKWSGVHLGKLIVIQMVKTRQNFE